MARDAVAEVRERTDIVDLVSGYVTLQRAGRGFKGLCPFHQEKTPSFIVFPDSQNFHCFGCGKGGDVFTFYMGQEHVEFREALQELARRAGVELTATPTVAPEVDAHRQRLIELNELAAAFYANILTNSQAGAVGRAAADARGLSDESIARFGIGFALDSWDALLRYLNTRGVDPAMAAEAGLLQTRETGGHYDRFRGRLMFPIRDRDGRVVGFGGRVVGEGEPKYLNSPQSAIFDKSALVYGLDLAKEEIRRRDQVVLVEGYMDVVTAHQFGYTNVVAAMGTAVTERQVAQVKRLSKNIVLALDADAAGQLATLRSLETMHDALDADQAPVPDAFGVIHFERKLNAEISIVRLPDGKDPDELIRHSPERWPEVVASALPFLDFFIESVTADVDPHNARAVSQAVSQAAPLLQQVNDRVMQSHYVALLAGRLRITDHRVILAEIRRRGIRSVSSDRRQPARATAARISAEDHLLALLLRHRALCQETMQTVQDDDLLDGRNRALLRFLADPRMTELSAEQIIAGLDDAVADHAERLLTSLTGKPDQAPGQVQREARQTLEQLRKERFTFLLRQLSAGIQAAQQAGDADSLADLQAQLALLSDRHQKFYPPPSPYFRDSRNVTAVKGSRWEAVSSTAAGR